MVRTLLAFNARESCGKCTPCREGTVRMLELLDGVPRAGVAASLGQLRELADVVQLASLCGLGQAAPLSLRAALEHFPTVLGARTSQSEAVVDAGRTGFTLRPPARQRPLRPSAACRRAR